MNIENLSEGQVIKNYRELCGILDIKVTGGDSKKAQLKEMNTYFEYEKQGNKFIINKIYNYKKIIIGGEGNNMFAKDIQLLLLDLLNQSDSGELFISTGALLRKLDMINDNYMVARRNIPKLSELTNVSQETCFDFYSYSQTSLKNKLDAAIKGLRNKFLIICDNVTMVSVKIPNIEINEFGTIKVSKNSKNYDIIDVKNTHRIATQWEKDLILRCEQQVREEICCLTMQEVYMRGKWNTFKKKVNQLIFDKANIEYYYSSYNITYVPETITKVLEDNVFDVDSTKNTLNLNIQNSLINGAATRNNTSSNRISDGEKEIHHKDLLFSNPKYVEDNQCLSNVVINNKCKDLRKELEKSLEADKKSVQIDLFNINDDIPF